jgi:hypothetical protein
MILRKCFTLFVAGAAVLTAQMTPEQRIVDFTQLASLYAKQYGPYEWKREIAKFDLLDIKPWLARVAAAKDDLEFLEICVDYVAALRDSHVFFSIPSAFFASLPISVDIYDGKVLIEGINRRLLPAGDYPFEIGDELVSVDGITSEEWMTRLDKYSRSWANPRGSRRLAASRIVTRPQSVMPRAHEVGDTATIAVRRAGGEIETYTIDWQKSGVPLFQAGPVPSPKTSSRAALGDSLIQFPPDTPEYLRPLLALGHTGVLAGSHIALLGFGALPPVFALPEGFQPRMGRSPADNYFTGTFMSGDLRIGFVRIPRMSPNTSLAAAWTQFENEIAYMEENTDGLIVDVMRNPGGFVIHTNELARRLIPYPFESLGFEMRATARLVANLSAQVESLKAISAPDWVIRSMEAVLRDMQQAFSENRGRTGPIPLDAETLSLLPARDSEGRLRAYTKPLIVLIDDFSFSGGDAFAATLQDAGRGLLVGTRSAGAGGTNGGFPATTFSEGTAGVTFGLMSRPKPVTTLEYGVTRYVENVGVRPDVELDYMTRDNLLQRGRPFMGAVTEIITREINKGR